MGACRSSVVRTPRILCPMQRVLDKRYTERDVEDVERLVREAVAAIGDVRPRSRTSCVVGGIFLVRRVARALPPEASLAEALKERLGGGSRPCGTITRLCARRLRRAFAPRRLRPPRPPPVRRSLTTPPQAAFSPSRG